MPDETTLALTPVTIKLDSLDVQHNLPQTTREFQPDKPPMKVSVDLWASVVARGNFGARIPKLIGEVQSVRTRIFENAPQERDYQLNQAITIEVDGNDTLVDVSVYIVAIAWGLREIPPRSGSFKDAGIFDTNPPAHVHISLLRRNNVWVFADTSNPPLPFRTEYSHGDRPYFAGNLKFELSFA